MGEFILQYLAIFLALLLVMPLHEFAHAFAAVKSGDNTPKYAGRYTLNPLAHFDPIGLIMLIVARFGWAKPVPINPYNFKHIRRGYFWTSVAGVIANYLTAFLVFPLYILFSTVLRFDFLLFDELLRLFLLYSFIISVNLVVFNLIPVYPLDGFRVLEASTKRRGPVFNFLRNEGYMVILGLILLSFVVERAGLPWYFDVFGTFMNLASGYLRYPITAFWSLVF